MPRVKQFNEDEVLSKAVNLFWKKGYSATSIQDLVSHLGINRASIYATYGDKENLFEQALRHYRKTNTTAISQLLEEEPDVKKGIKRLFESAIESSAQDIDRKGCFIVNTTTELIPGDEKIYSMLEENRNHIERLVYNYLKKGQTEGQLDRDKDIKSISSLLFTLYNGLKVVSKVGSDQRDLLSSVHLALTLLD